MVVFLFAHVSQVHRAKKPQYNPVHMETVYIACITQPLPEADT